MHHSFAVHGNEKDKWLSRNAAFVVAAGMPAARIENSIATTKERLAVLAPEQDEAILRDSGFRDIELFYAAFTFKGWVCLRA